MKILFPAVRPVRVLRFFDKNGSIAQIITVLPELFDLVLDPAFHFLRRHMLLFRTRLYALQGSSGIYRAVVRFTVLDHKISVFIFLQIEAQDRSSVVCRSFRQDVNEHLLFFGGRKRHMILDLRPVQAYVFHM